MKAINIENFSYSYDSRKILDNIDLSVNEGEFLSVIGPNGAGKSTLIKCLCKIATEISCGIEIYGKKLEDYKQVELSKLVGYVPQSDGRTLPFTAKEFILMSRYPYTKAFSSFEKTDYEACQKAMILTGIQNFAERTMDKMSGGERQKILIAAALAQDAKILLLDEPTTFLDPKHQAEVMDIARSINKNNNITVINVTHDLNAAINSSDRIAAIKKGKIVFDSDVSSFIKEKYAEEIFETPFNYASCDENGISSIYIFPK